MGDSSSTVVLPAPSSPRMNLNGLPSLLLFLALFTDLSSTMDVAYAQVIEAFPGEVNFKWKYDVRPFLWMTMTFNGEEIVSSKVLPHNSEAFKLEQFKGRLRFTSLHPFSFALENATKKDSGTYICTFSYDAGKTVSFTGVVELHVKVGDGHEPFTIDTNLTPEPHQEIRSDDNGLKIGSGVGGSILVIAFLCVFGRQIRGKAQKRRIFPDTIEML